MLVRINRFSAGDKRKQQRVIRFPKLLDVYKMCDISLQESIAVGRNLHNEELAKHASQIAQYKSKLKSTPYYTIDIEGLDSTQIAYSCFESVWKSYEYDDRYFNLSDVDYHDCWSGCYNLVGFTTHIGEHPQQAEFATVIQMNRHEWYHCTTSGVSILTLDQALNEFNGATQNEEESTKDCETAELLLYRKVYYACDREL